MLETPTVQQNREHPANAESTPQPHNLTTRRLAREAHLTRQATLMDLLNHTRSRAPDISRQPPSRHKPKAHVLTNTHTQRATSTYQQRL
jgi:hypothetical protein